VQEVRRFYPFTPAIGAVVADDFEWRGHRFRKGTLALVDVYGMPTIPMSGRAPPSSIRTDLLAGSQVLSTSAPRWWRL
jgi:hypothetical protein